MTTPLVFFRCAHCNTVAWKLYDGRAPLVCCGEPMSELAPNTTDAAQEKHVPVVTRADGRLTVTVGSVTHPMEEKHFIGFVAVLSGAQVSLRFLSPGDTPSFTLSDEHCDAVYAWCNLHGLWKAQL